MSFHTSVPEPSFLLVIFGNHSKIKPNYFLFRHFPFFNFFSTCRLKIPLTHGFKLLNNIDNFPKLTLNFVPTQRLLSGPVDNLPSGIFTGVLFRPLSLVTHRPKNSLSPQTN